MGVWYEWADESQLIINLYIEQPWTLDEYWTVINEIFPMIREIGQPRATVRSQAS